jgi:streptogramin lyase
MSTQAFAAFGVHEHSIPTPGALPMGITLGPDHNIWFVEFEASKVGRVSIEDGQISEFAVPGLFPEVITAGPDGNLWVGTNAATILTIATDGTVLRNLPVLHRRPVVGITVGPDGNIWFAAIDQYSWVGLITPSGDQTMFRVPGGQYTLINGITAGPDGNLWFSLTDSNNVGRVAVDGTITMIPVGRGQDDIAAGPDGNMWFTSDFFPASIGRISPQGGVATFPLAHPHAQPWSITPGPDGNMWFTDSHPNMIGMITSEGSIAEFVVPTDEAFPRDITAGRKGRMWFTEQFANQIASFHV